jgi:hypothetical protein
MGTIVAHAASTRAAAVGEEQHRVILIPFRRVPSTADGAELALVPAPVQLAEDDRAHRAGVVDDEPQQTLADRVGQRHLQVILVLCSPRTSAHCPGKRIMTTVFVIPIAC